MSALGIVVALVGVLVAVTRGALVFAPRAALDWQVRVTQSDLALRGAGALLVVLGPGLIYLAREERGAAGLLAVLGCLWALMALWLLASPTSYRRVALEWLEFFRDSADPAVVRILGLLGAAIGVALVYAGLFAL